MARLKEKYREAVVPEMMKRFGYKGPMQVPRLDKIVLNMGVGDAKQNSSVLDAAIEQLSVIGGQRPSIRKARKSIAGFKLREGMPVGAATTLRRERMYEFLDRLISVAIPRVRDFRGLSTRSFDGHGNYSLGIREQIVFPEVDYDSIDQIRGLDISITTTAASDDEAYELLRALGMPFKGDLKDSRSVDDEDQPKTKPEQSQEGVSAEQGEASGSVTEQEPDNESGQEEESEAGDEEKPEAVQEEQPESDEEVTPDNVVDPEKAE